MNLNQAVEAGNLRRHMISVHKTNMAVEARCAIYLKQEVEESFQSNNRVNKCLGPGLQWHALESKQ